MAFDNGATPLHWVFERPDVPADTVIDVTDLPNPASPDAFGIGPAVRLVPRPVKPSGFSFRARDAWARHRRRTGSQSFEAC